MNLNDISDECPMTAYKEYKSLYYLNTLLFTNASLYEWGEFKNTFMSKHTAIIVLPIDIETHIIHLFHKDKSYVSFIESRHGKDSDWDDLLVPTDEFVLIASRYVYCTTLRILDVFGVIYDYQVLPKECNYAQLKVLTDDNQLIIETLIDFV